MHITAVLLRTVKPGPSYRRTVALDRRTVALDRRTVALSNPRTA